MDKDAESINGRNDDSSQGVAGGALMVGDTAPDFTLPTHNEGELNLAWYRGRKKVVLAFYPGDWTPVCATQVPELQAVAERFEQANCQLLAISVDSIPSHRAWAISLGGISFPLMSDYFSHGTVAQKYGILNKRGYAERTVFVIDMQGTIRYIERLNINQLPDNEKILSVVAELDD